MARAHGVSSFEARCLTAATGAAALDGATLTNLDSRLVVDGGIAHTFLDLAGHGQEGLLDVGCVLGRCLEEGNAEAVGEFLCDGVLDDLLVSHIALVADEKLVDTLGSVAVNLLQPLLDVVERVHVGNIVDDADTVGAAVVRGCDGTETLLACGVPNLELHCLAIELDGSDFEVNTNGGDVALGVGVICESEQQTRLSDTGVTDEEKLEEVVVFGVHGGRVFLGVRFGVACYDARKMRKMSKRTAQTLVA